MNSYLRSACLRSHADNCVGEKLPENNLPLRHFFRQHDLFTVSNTRVECQLNLEAEVGIREFVLCVVRQINRLSITDGACFGVKLFQFLCGEKISKVVLAAPRVR